MTEEEIKLKKKKNADTPQTHSFDKEASSIEHTSHEIPNKIRVQNEHAQKRSRNPSDENINIPNIWNPARTKSIVSNIEHTIISPASIKLQNFVNPSHQLTTMSETAAVFPMYGSIFLLSNRALFFHQMCLKFNKISYFPVFLTQWLV